jgi:hypothetical protein
MEMKLQLNKIWKLCSRIHDTLDKYMGIDQKAMEYEIAWEVQSCARQMNYVDRVLKLDNNIFGRIPYDVLLQNKTYVESLLPRYSNNDIATNMILDKLNEITLLINKYNTK